jgi:hypothetical protein
VSLEGVACEKEGAACVDEIVVVMWAIVCLELRKKSLLDGV